MPIKILVVAVLCIILIVAVAAVLFYNSLIYRPSDNTDDYLNPEQFEQEQIDNDANLHDDFDEITISELSTPSPDLISAEDDSDNIRYILLIGLDARSATNWDRTSSDVIKLLAIDKNNNEIKIVSFMRDILVPIDAQTEDNGSQKYGKLNSVYYYNGPDGLCETITNYFGVPVDEYVIINLSGTAKMIDALGGVTINVPKGEIDAINEIILSHNILRSIEYASPLYRGGEQTLNGSQGLAYMRVRKVGNGDFDRVERQVVVLRSLYDSLRTASLDELLQLSTVLQDVVKTNIKSIDMVSYVNMGYSMSGAQITSLRVPVEQEDSYLAGIYNDRYVLQVDFNANMEYIYKFINNIDE